VLAGVAGSRIASELGNMRVSEQIDALEIMGINTKTYLILPKIAAALLMIPFLVIIAMVLGIWGGRLAGTMAGILSGDTYDRGLLEYFVPYNVFFALTKAYFFAFIISSIPSFYGYYGRGLGDRPGQYQGCSGKLHSYPVRRLCVVSTFTVSGHRPKLFDILFKINFECIFNYQLLQRSCYIYTLINYGDRSQEYKKDVW
jgi:hypothetical protein